MKTDEILYLLVSKDDKHLTPEVTNILIKDCIKYLEKQYEKSTNFVKFGNIYFQPDNPEWNYVKESLNFNCKVCLNKVQLLYKYQRFLRNEIDLSIEQLADIRNVLKFTIEDVNKY